MTRVEPISAGDPVISVSEAQDFLRVEGGEVFLDILIKGITRKVEEQFGAAISQKSYRQTMDSVERGVELPDIWHPPRQVKSFAKSRIELYRQPVQSITSLKTIDEDGNETTIATSKYYLGGDTLVLRESLPTHRAHGGIVIEYVAGYSTIPESVKADLKRVIYDAYEHRGLYVVGTVVGKLPDTDGMFAALRRVT